jgi:hypothetical protein
VDDLMDDILTALLVARVPVGAGSARQTVSPSA